MRDDMLRRRRLAEESIHSVELDDGSVTPWMRQTIQRWVEGQISIEEVVSLAKAHYSQEPVMGEKEETMSDLKVDPTPIELGEQDRERFEKLDRMAERGEIRPSGKHRTRPASAGPISEEEFEATMALGRPRAEEGTGR